MPNTRDLRRRRRSITNTGKITRAMQMVAATKMRRAQAQVMSARPYILTLSFALSKVSGKINISSHPLLQSNDGGKTGVLVLTSDKGFCGALNSNIFRTISTNPLIAEAKNISFFTVGKKGRDYLVRNNKNLEADFENPDRVEFAQAVQIRKFLIDLFIKGEINETYLLYSDFISTFRQEPKLIKLMPIDLSSLMTTDSPPHPDSHSKASSEFLFEPNPAAVLDYALIHLVDTQIYQAMLETKASEFSARMMTMQNATDNAKDLVGDLTLAYNQARQGAITRELLEIASAGTALEAV